MQPSCQSMNYGKIICTHTNVLHYINSNMENLFLRFVNIQCYTHEVKKMDTYVATFMKLH